MGLGGVVLQILYHIIRALCHGFQTVAQQFNGVAAHRRLIFNKDDPSKELTAEVCTVIGRLPCNGISVGLEDDNQFILWHQKFTTADDLLRPEVSLYFVDDTSAYFVETPSDLDIHNTEKHPFFYMTQQDHCTHVIILPLEKFLEISTKLGAPKCQLTFLLHSARCGSTAVTQAIHSIPNWKVMSESCFIHKHIYQMEHKHKVNLIEYLKSERFYNVGEAAISYMFKDCPEGMNVFYKAFGLLDYCLIPMLSERFPSHKIITMHRDGQGTCKSHFQAFRDTTAYDFTAFALNNRLIYTIFRPLVSRVLFVVTNGMTSEFTDVLIKTKCRDIFLYHFVRWVANSIQYVNYSNLAPNILSVMFEELKTEKTATITKIFEYLEIPKAQLPLALAALERDSQKGTLLSRAYVQQNPTWIRDVFTVRECESLLQRYNLPAFDQKFRFCPNKGLLLC